ncbi:hypothetical protein [Homoserinibacter sp. YIM 151385]|uniref:hypothetical protein n=1 Tax=Homoserinibacter sp. YIM 151385 TaxID=2985506 RepID=UPI0022F05064|nr:hypothetical protein [Homoserinibacter sp. YIM 151385]WBU37196.1 hypothetical protein OF852_09715 [Homoserinibacter sp. YIM 151385]
MTKDADRDRWWDRLNRALFPYFGPAQLGTGRQPDQPLPSAERRAERPCPLCGRPMTEHRLERTRDQHTSTRLHCPV